MIFLSYINLLFYKYFLIKFMISFHCVPASLLDNATTDDRKAKQEKDRASKIRQKIGKEEKYIFLPYLNSLELKILG